MPLNAYCLPPIFPTRIRRSAYQRIYSIRTEEELRDVEEELRDRYEYAAAPVKTFSLLQPCVSPPRRWG